MHNFLFYNKFIIFLYMFRALLCSSSEVKLYYTASGIFTVCRGLSGAQVERRVLSQPANRTTTYRVWRYQMLYNTIWPPDDEHNSARNM